MDTETVSAMAIYGASTAAVSATASETFALAYLVWSGAVLATLMLVGGMP